MNSPRKNMVLTGPPGCGKTTIVRRVVGSLQNRRLAGFYTQEICQHGQRAGFAAVGPDGQLVTLAHVDFRGKNRVGRYGVDLASFDAIVHKELGRSFEEVDLFVIDEIGKMECLSAVFIETVARLLDSPVNVLATVAVKGGGFIAEAKARHDVETITVTAANRHNLPDELVRRFQ